MYEGVHCTVYNMSLRGNTWPYSTVYRHIVTVTQGFCCVLLSPYPLPQGEELSFTFELFFHFVPHPPHPLAPPPLPV